MATVRAFPRALFVSHGGGPLPLLNDPAHQQMVSCLRSLAASLPRPSAIVVISAHWEAEVPTITSGATPSIIYDYYGFPPESYEIKYPCRGEPTLANDTFQRFERAGIKSRLDESRGFDHGLFVPLSLMYPNADIPCIQVSLVNTLDPLAHIEIGQALSGLSQQNVLVMGSGFTFHNLRQFFLPVTAAIEQQNVAFEAWLQQVCGSAALTESERREKLIHWNTAPAARFCHPREEHLLPLHVCYGAAQTPYSEHFEVSILQKKSSMIVW